MSVINLVTLENLESKKHLILNSVSTFGKINSIENWYSGLSLFVFENENVEDAVTSYLINEFDIQLKEFRKTFYN